MPRRPRSPRRTTSDLLRRWALTVRGIERGTFDPHACCPCCDATEALYVRDVLADVVRRGGRRGRRVAAALAPLDARFLRATLPAPWAPQDEPW